MNPEDMKLLGLSFYYHDSAACLLVDGVPIAMSEEERFSRKKHDDDFPQLAIDFVLKEGGIKATDLDGVIFYEKPFIKLDRIIRSAVATFPFAPLSFASSIKTLFVKKLWIRHLISQRLKISQDKIFFSEHHFSHIASTYFCSPWEKAAILTIDGVGEWTTTSLAVGDKNKITVINEIHYPHSLGLLYSAFTAFLGFEVNEGEYKVMGMAPYGTPRYTEKVERLIKTFSDGSFAMNLEYFAYHRSNKKSYSKKFVQLFGKPRDPKSRFFTRTTGWPSYFGEKPTGESFDKLATEQEYYADVAASVQAVLEKLVIGLVNNLYKITQTENLCLAGGVALNSVSNWKILQHTQFKRIFIQPAAGDAGGALGAALAYELIGSDKQRPFVMKHAYYGKSYTNDEVKSVLDDLKISYEYVPEENVLINRVAQALSDGKVIGWYQGRFEWGPRALGNRSILADPRRVEMKDIVNTKIKFREPYRPFAPSVLAERAGEFFELPDATEHYPARYMLFVVPVREEKRSLVPAITHVDGSARPQTVFREESPRYYRLIERFGELTGVPLILDTSFNLKGEPIVTSPKNALKTFAKSGMDLLVLENYLITRQDITQFKYE